ncbi:MAG: toll/interleukin-1 receptor domain-containing protein [Nitrospirota bacterium]
MKIFISWSGKASLIMATALKEILPSIIQALDPFLSSQDIESGTRWFSEIGAHLEEKHYGILCLTPTNLTAPWILFEAGALSKAVDRSRVVPLLIKVSTSDLTPPLSQFNGVKAAKKDMHKLIEEINKHCEKPLEGKRLNDTFDKFWPDLERAINSTIEELGKGEELSTPKRDERQLLEEILDLSRDISSKLETIPKATPWAAARAMGYLPTSGYSGSAIPSSGMMGTPYTMGIMPTSGGAIPRPSDTFSGGVMRAPGAYENPPTSGGVMPKASDTFPGGLMSHRGAYAYPDEEDKKD